MKIPVKVPATTTGWTFYASIFLVVFYFWFTKPAPVEQSLSEEELRRRR